MITVSTKVLLQDGKVNQRTKELLGNKQFNVIAYLDKDQDMEEEASKISKILDKENLNWIIITFVITPYQEAKKALEYNSLHFTNDQAVRNFLTQQGLFVVYMTKG